YAHVPDNHRKKLDNKSIKCVHLGISDESKAYKLYNPVEKKIVISRAVVFDESKSRDWDNKQKNVNAGNEILIEDNAEETTVTDNDVPTGNNNDTPMQTVDTDVGYESTDSEDEPTEEQNISNEGARVRKPPGHLKDFVLGSEAEYEQELQNLVVYSSCEDPYSYDEACKNQVWK
ncbi:hypothetical protein A2U01_0048620, partial [Trifolium medium]|nr:hypothetical protein [Trifolium medium]